MKNYVTKRFPSLFLIIFLFVSALSFSQIKTSQEAVKAGQFDNGKMWTFDYPPMDYFAKTYNFKPTKEWFEKTRLAAIRLPGCSASFISEDGLVMSNHHCARQALDAVNKKGENLQDEGFYASTLEEERKAPGYFVDQLQLIEDVTKEVQEAFDNGKTDEEKIKNRGDKIREIEKRYNEKTGLTCRVETFYNGGRYSLYGYKRYTDLRLVFAVETQIGFYGGDPDNFTYPRYDVDLSLFRVYDTATGKPLKTSNFYKWSDGGVKEGDAVFVIGNPGRTSRLLTVSQLQFNRDVAYPFTVNFLDDNVKMYGDYIEKHPEKKQEYLTRFFSYSNSQKAYKGQLSGLLDPNLMARKIDFEKNFKAAVMKSPALKAKYATLWDDIDKLQKEKAVTFPERIAYTFKAMMGRGGGYMSAYFSLASDLVTYAKQMKLPEEKREKEYKGPALDMTKDKLVLPKFENEMQEPVLFGQLNFIKNAIGEKNESVKNLFKGKSPEELAKDIMNSSKLNDKEAVKALVNGKPDDILNSDDPVISFVAKNIDKGKEARDKYTEIIQKEQAKVQVLGKAIYDVYGTQMPPDATFTLRISDGVVKGYPYNGTIAPPITTFYGMYDRYYSFKKSDWDLPEKWRKPSADFDLSKPLDFVCTSDIIGGNSGSPVINKNQEVVGLIFDGNIESLPGDFIFIEETNRAVAVHSEGILEALKDIYKADRIVKELKSGKIVK